MNIMFYPDNQQFPIKDLQACISEILDPLEDFRKKRVSDLEEK